MMSIFIVLCSLLLSIPVTAQPQPDTSDSGAENAVASAPDRGGPRDAFRSFLLAMIDYSSTGNEDEASKAIARATACIDLSGIPSALREQRGIEIARDLKSFLDRYELVDLEEIPERSDETQYLWRKPMAGAEVSLGRDSAGVWRFSQRTVTSLPALLDLVSGRAVVEGVETTVAPDTFADWVRSHVPESLRTRGMYLENWQWIALLLVVIIGIMVERIVVTMFSTWTMRLLRRGGLAAGFEIDRQLIKPTGIFAMALSWSLLMQLLDLPIQAATVLFFATQIVIVGSGVWAAYRLVDLLTSYLASMASRTESKFDDLLVPMIRRGLKIIVLAFGLLFVADNFDIDITSLLAGLGIGGIAFALAAKDTVENMFGSLTVLFDKPFEIGDWIKVGDLEGTVEEVGFRSTRIRTFYNSQITMPNSRLVNTAVDNLGRRRYRRISMKLGVQYDTPPERIDAFCEGIRELIRLHPYTRKDMYMVYFNEFADFSLNILLYVFHEAPDWPTELRERHRLFGDILRLARRLGVEFAFPTQTLHIASAPGGGGMPSFPPVRAGSDTTSANDDASATEQHGDMAAEALAAMSMTEEGAPASMADLSEAALLGRREAEAMVRALWGDIVQEPVSFDVPTSLSPARGAKTDEQ
ncbi:MAG: mechanosensitive ion channel family protein [Bacteroidetes bacterium]|nr:mechanosensitive ion channel family protein [Bacteroidota bacterium]